MPAPVGPEIEKSPAPSMGRAIERELEGAVEAGQVLAADGEDPHGASARTLFEQLVEEGEEVVRERVLVLALPLAAQHLLRLEVGERTGLDVPERTARAGEGGRDPDEPCLLAVHRLLEGRAERGLGPIEPDLHLEQRPRRLRAVAAGGSAATAPRTSSSGAGSVPSGTLRSSTKRGMRTMRCDAERLALELRDHDAVP